MFQTEISRRFISVILLQVIVVQYVNMKLVCQRKLNQKYGNKTTPSKY